MTRLCNSVAKSTDNFKKIDEEMAYSIFIVEKEFNVGKVDDKFPAMKLFNLLDEMNLKRYNKMTSGKSSSKDVTTFG